MHWLAYWNDAKSVKYLLDIVEENVSKEKLHKLMNISFNGMTPIDTAGGNKSIQAATQILNYFSHKFHFVELIFDIESVLGDATSERILRKFVSNLK
jgi:hypothetical protein